MAAQHFEVNGVRYESVPLEDFDFDEIHEFQRVSGVNFGRAVFELAENNGDAWKAWMLVAMRRTNPSLDETAFKGVRLMRVLEQFYDLEGDEEEPDPRPDPPIAPPSEHGGNGASDTGSTTEPTPANFGIPHG